MSAARRRVPQNLINLLLDTAIFCAFLIATAPRLTGIAIHEWLSIAFGAAIVTHLLLHWQWIVGVTRWFLSRAQWRARVNYVLNTLFFIDMTIILFTGLMISEVALPLLGVRVAPDRTWRLLHGLASDAGVFILGLHVALHWQWIVNALKRHILKPLFGSRRAAPAMSAAKEARS